MRTPTSSRPTHKKSTLFLSLLVLSSASSVVAQGVGHKSPSLDHKRMVVQRQETDTAVTGAASTSARAPVSTSRSVTPVVTESSTSAVVESSSAPISTSSSSVSEAITSSSAEPSSSSSSIVESSSTPSSTSSSTSITPTPTSSSTSTTPTSSSTSTSSSSSSSSSVSTGVDSTVTVPGLVSRTSAGTSAKVSASAGVTNNSTSNSGGLPTYGKALIAVAAVLVGLALIGFLVRKFVFAKRRRNRSTPLDFSNGGYGLDEHEFKATEGAFAGGAVGGEKASGDWERRERERMDLVNGLNDDHQDGSTGGAYGATAPYASDYPPVGGQEYNGAGQGAGYNYAPYTSSSSDPYSAAGVGAGLGAGGAGQFNHEGYAPSVVSNNVAGYGAGGYDYGSTTGLAAAGQQGSQEGHQHQQHSGEGYSQDYDQGGYSQGHEQGGYQENYDYGYGQPHQQQAHQQQGYPPQQHQY